jgi:hypothetical protein
MWMDNFGIEKSLGEVFARSHDTNFLGFFWQASEEDKGWSLYSFRLNLSPIAAIPSLIGTSLVTVTESRS